MKVVKNLATLFTSLGILLLVGAFILNNFVYINKPLQIAVNSTPLLHSESGGQGSGVIFINGDKTFLWTCHHVITSNITLEMNFDGKTSKYSTQVKTKDVKVTSLLFHNDMEVGKLELRAKIIRFSEKDDVALLELPHGYFRQSVTFPTTRKYVPLVGAKLFHVGNFNGTDGEKSVSDGLCGVCGLDVDGNNICYDRVGLNLQPGSSGGGVFEVCDGKCIGLMARSTSNKIFNQGLIVPFRRLQEIATRLDCEWALHRQFAPGPDYLNTLSHDTWDIPEEVQKILRHNK